MPNDSGNHEIRFCCNCKNFTQHYVSYLGGLCFYPVQWGHCKRGKPRVRKRNEVCCYFTSYEDEGGEEDAGSEASEAQVL